MSWVAPNLARQPFENLRPLRRISTLLAVAALTLTAWNLGTWLRTGAGAAEKAAELERLETETAKAREEIETLEADLLTEDLEERNQQVEFLNEQIAARTFSWNRLFDHVVEVLPQGVRLRRVTPRIEHPNRSERATDRRPIEEDSVLLALSAEAESHSGFLEFIDNLIAHPRFERVDPSGESKREDGLVQFNLTALYRPGRTAEDAP